MGVFLHFSLLLSWIGLKMNWQTPVLWKPLKGKSRFRCFIACSVKVTCIVTIIVLENMFGNIKINSFYLRGNRGGEIALLSLHVCRCSRSVSIIYKVLKIRKLSVEGLQFLRDFKMSLFRLKYHSFFNKKPHILQILKNLGWQAWLSFWSIYNVVSNFVP